MRRLVFLGGLVAVILFVFFSLDPKENIDIKAKPVPSEKQLDKTLQEMHKKIGRGAGTCCDAPKCACYGICQCTTINRCDPECDCPEKKKNGNN